MTLANMPEPGHGERVRALSESLAVDVAKKRERIEQKIPNRTLDALKGSDFALTNLAHGQNVAAQWS